MTTCLITGCALIDGDRSLWGDLHAVGDCYVFNGVVVNDGRPQWLYNHDWPLTTKALEVLPAASAVHYAFERRGVVVIPKTAARLNQAASHYLLQGVPS